MKKKGERESEKCVGNWKHKSLGVFRTPVQNGKGPLITGDIIRARAAIRQMCGIFSHSHRPQASKSVTVIAWAYLGGWGEFFFEVESSGTPTIVLLLSRGWGFDGLKISLARNELLILWNKKKNATKTVFLLYYYWVGIESCFFFSFLTF